MTTTQSPITPEAITCPCPRCGKPFTHDDDLRNEFTQACVHCQLPKWN